jgi:proline iminopeptidase
MKLAIYSLFIINSIIPNQVREGYAPGMELDTWYKMFGSGERTMLIINGGPGFNSRGFESLAVEISKRFGIKTVIYDQRGTGYSLSETGNTRISMDLMIQDIEDLRNHLGLEEWMVFGQSFGGMLASYYATQHSDHVSGMILSSSGGINMQHLQDLHIMDRLAPEELKAYQYWDSKLDLEPQNEMFQYNRNRYLASAYVVDDAHIDQIANRLMQADMNLNRMVFQDMASMGFDCSEGLKNFQQPVLIINGEKDIVSPGAAFDTHSLLNNSELEFVERSGHYGWLDNPEEYFMAIANWFYRLEVK